MHSNAGPDTIEHFHQFSLESIAADLKQQSPDLYALFLKVADTCRNVDGDDLGVEDVKAIGSLCALLNARSNRVKGLQLISLMLIARATSRQVSYHANIMVHKINVHVLTGNNNNESLWLLHVIHICMELHDEACKRSSVHK